MLSLRCKCGQMLSVDHTLPDVPVTCPRCSTPNVCPAGELAEAGDGGFGAAIEVVAGPSRVGQLIHLGGRADLGVGKQPGNHIQLPGNLVSRAHCKLVRISSEPSRWRIDDNRSTNGLFVNEKRVESQELHDGDIVQIGEYQLRYHPVLPVENDVTGDLELAPVDDIPIAPPATRGRSVAAARTAAPDIMVGSEPPDYGSGPACPSCQRRLGAKARVCIDCGIHIPSGRPLLTSAGVDENVLHGNTQVVLQVISFLVWVTPLPIPLASEAYGKFKPYAIWSIAALTTLVSIWFLIATMNGNGSERIVELWGRSESTIAQDQPDDTLIAIAKSLHIDTAAAEELPFRWWQLLTSAMLHDPSDVFSFIMHLGGNMLFMFVFGSRVNSIIGNVATAIIYPVLAVAAGLVYLATMAPGPAIPCLGASGAINGLAGMYLVLFPAHHVYCAMWVRVRWRLFLKIFALRGFWVLLIYFAYDLLMISLAKHTGTAHWAHVGGFVTGVVIAIGLLASRKFDCRNGDLLSVTLGKYAWPLIGKPNRFSSQPAAV